MRLNGRDGYRCKNIKIKKGSKFLNFQCLKRLEPCLGSSNESICEMELLPEGGTVYEITIKTNDDKGSGTTSPILIGVIGEKGISNMQMLSDKGCGAGNQITSIIKINDVGNITGYQIELAEKGKWKGSYLIIKKIKDGELKQFDCKDVYLTNPGINNFKYDPSQNRLIVNSSNLAGINNLNQKNNYEFLSLNDEGIIGKTGSPNKNFDLADIENLEGDNQDDGSDAISLFSKYESDKRKKSNKYYDLNSSTSATLDSNVINLKENNLGVISSQEKQGKIYKITFFQ